MRVNAKWTPSGLLLWFVAAVVATFVVCVGAKPEPPTQEPPTEIEFEVQTSGQN